MLYLLGMSARVVVGTSLFQILFVTAATTMVHAMTTRAVDLVLAALLLLGSVAGAQVGARFAAEREARISAPRARHHRAARGPSASCSGSTWRPDEIYSVELS